MKSSYTKRHNTNNIWNLKL